MWEGLHSEKHEKQPTAAALMAVLEFISHLLVWQYFSHSCRMWEGFHSEKHLKQPSPAALMSVLENSPVLCAYGLIRSGGTKPAAEGTS